MKFEAKHNNYHSRKFIEKCHLRNGVQFVSTSISWGHFLYRQTRHASNIDCVQNIIILTPNESHLSNSFCHWYPVMYISWWGHQMETFSALPAICEGNHRSPVDSPRKSQWRGALIFCLIWTNGGAYNQDTGDLRRHRAHYEVTVMCVSANWGITNSTMSRHLFSDKPLPDSMFIYCR